MKIPEGTIVSKGSDVFEKWCDGADVMSTEYGVFVDVWFDWNDAKDHSRGISRLYYKIGEHEFESLRDLRKALELKSFM